MLSPFVISFIFGVGFFLIIMSLWKPEGSVFAEDSREGLLDNIDLKLRKAGITSVTPSVVIILGIIGTVILAFVVFFATKSLIAPFLSLPVVPLAMSFWLDYQSRNFQDKLTNRLVPFLRKIESQIRSGQNPSRAFVTAVQEDKLLSWVLKEQLQDIKLQRPFDEVLEESIEVIPLSPWLEFIRSMQAFSESGGRLSDILSSNVERINSRILLKQKLLGDVAPYRAQQIVILGFAVATPLILFFISKDTFGSIFDSVGGIIMLLFAVGLDVLALFIINRAIKDVEGRLEA